ncbi:MAG: hypothetical protein ACRCTQ_05220 [Brevinemataceae bacterium]
MFVLIIVIFLFSGCSFIPSAPADLLSAKDHFGFMSLEDMGRRYPFFQLEVSFKVLNQEIGWVDNPTPEQRRKAKILTGADKAHMLARMDIMRFGINTPEFAERIMKGIFISARDATGPNGSVAKGQPLENRRLLETLQNSQLKVEIIKSSLPSSSYAGCGSVGFSRYVCLDSRVSTGWVKYPNRDEWDSSPSLLNGTWGVEILFHEFLHNIGFSHLDSFNPYDPQNDTVYNIQNALRDTLYDPKWQQKYSEQYNAYKYFRMKYDFETTFDTVPVSKSQDLIPQFLAYTHHHDMPNYDEEEMICTMKEDGTYEVKIVKKA